MAKGEVTSKTLTLRFKHGTTTIFVFADILTPIPKVKEDLLETLRETHPNGLPPPPSSSSIARIPIPKSIEAIRFAVPKNTNDLSEGWRELEAPEVQVNGDITVPYCPASLGLSDASMLAFVLTGETEPEFWAEFSDVDELYPEEDS